MPAIGNNPVIVAENTNNSRVPAVTGIFKPVTIAELWSPIEIRPGKAILTCAVPIGLKMLVDGAIDRYTCAVMLRVVPTPSDKDAVVLK